MSTPLRNRLWAALNLTPDFTDDQVLAVVAGLAAVARECGCPGAIRTYLSAHAAAFENMRREEKEAAEAEARRAAHELRIAASAKRSATLKARKDAR